MPSRAAPAWSIGRSRSAGSQKLGAEKIAPSARAARSRSPTSFFFPSASRS